MNVENDNDEKNNNILIKILLLLGIMISFLLLLITTTGISQIGIIYMIIFMFYSFGFWLFLRKMKPIIAYPILGTANLVSPIISVYILDGGYISKAGLFGCIFIGSIGYFFGILGLAVDKDEVSDTILGIMALTLFIGLFGSLLVPLIGGS